MMAEAATDDELLDDGQSQSQSQSQTQTQSQSQTQGKRSGVKKTSDSSKSMKGAKRADGVEAYISTDGALILDAPDHDASPIAQYAEGHKVRVSKKTVPGTGESAGERFRKVRVGSRIGYVPEIDVRLGQPAAQVLKRKEKKADGRSRSSTESQGKKNPMYFSRYMGLIGGSSEFKEDITGVDASTTMLVYGFKLTGPDILLEGPIIDFNFLLHFGAPTYYEPLSAVKPTGYVILTDASVMVPLIARENAMVYMVTGPLLMYSQFNVVNGSRARDLTEANLGWNLGLAVGARFQKVAVRLEGKYFIEKRSYRAVLASLQTEF